MSYRISVIVFALVAVGCGSSEPEREEKPLTQRPVPTTGITPASTPEEKIKYIENSKAPDSVKKDAIARIQAGKL